MIANPRETRRIQAVLFDLDACLSAANEVGDHLFEPAFRAIREANKGEVSDETLAGAFADCWRFPFDSVADKYGFSPAMRAAGFEVFRQTEVRGPMHGYGDLDVLYELPAKLFLVTSGFRRLQESKVRALGIAHLFSRVHIDAIDEPGRQTKYEAFKAILREHDLLSDEVLVVGDNPDSEIAAGNRLGIFTIQILRPGVPASDTAKRRIQSLTELPAVLSELSRG